MAHHDIILQCLEKGPATRDDLMLACFGHRKDGGPQTADTVLKVEMHRLKKKGYKIKRVYILEK